MSREIVQRRPSFTSWNADYRRPMTTKHSAGASRTNNFFRYQSDARISRNNDFRDKQLSVTDSALDLTAGKETKKNSKIVLDKNRKHLMLIAQDGKKSNGCKSAHGSR